MSDYKVKTTKSFNMFQISENNRKVDEKHVQKFVKEFEKNGYLVAFPIVAVIEKGRYKIIDGQHRFLAAKKVGCYFSFIEIDIVDEADWLEKLQKVNKLSKKWATLDYLRLSKDESVVEVVKIIDENKDYAAFRLQYSGLASLWNRKNLTTNTSKEEIAEAVLIWSKLSKYSGTRQNIAALIIRLFIKNKLNVDRLLKNIEKQPLKFVSCATAQQFREMIEYFYNYDYPKANRIKFDI